MKQETARQSSAEDRTARAEKKEIRKRYLAVRRALTQEERRAADSAILSRVLALPQVRESRTFFCYVSLPDEPDTLELMERLLRLGKRVCAPQCEVARAQMDAYRISSLGELVPGAYGILEPEPRERVEPEEIDCVFVPGCVFGRNFHRIGYGGGYYDRFLPRAARAVRIGLCYGCCLAESVEPGEFDVPVDRIVTEKEVLAGDDFVF